MSGRVQKTREKLQYLILVLYAVFLFMNMPNLLDIETSKSQTEFKNQEKLQPYLTFEKIDSHQSTWLDKESMLKESEMAIQIDELDFHNKQISQLTGIDKHVFSKNIPTILKPEISKISYDIQTSLYYAQTRHSTLSTTITLYRHSEGQLSQNLHQAVVRTDRSDEESTESHPLQTTLGIQFPQGFMPKVSSKGESVASGGNEPPKRSITELAELPRLSPPQLPHQTRWQFVGRTRNNGDYHDDDDDENSDDNNEDEHDAERS